MNVSNKRTDHVSQDQNLLDISQLHHPSKEIKAKRINENQSRQIYDKLKELKKNWTIITNIEIL